MSAPRLVIVADDLTGAADSAARCVQAGLPAEIRLELSSQATSVDASIDVIALSTDSRFLAPHVAAQRVTETVAALSAWSGATWYKKIDSTLRGNLGAEVEAMLAALPGMVAVICPAFPAQGRGLEAGSLVYAGAPPRHLPTLLCAQSRLPVAEIGLATVREGAAVLQRALQAQRAEGAKLLVVDALSASDLETIVAATQGDDYLLCGSAGMVAPLAARWVGQTVGAAKPAHIHPGPILAVVGSGSEMAHAQVAQIAAREMMRVRTLDNDWYELDLIGAQSHPVGDWLLTLPPPEAGMALEGAVARALAARLADVAFVAVERVQPSVLLVVGGDTAYYVLRRLGLARLTVVEELLPGIPLTFGVDRNGQRRAVVLKPGNFGDEQTLVALHQALRQRQT